MQDGYILYCAQLSNFQTRSMLVPEKYRDKFDLLRKHAKNAIIINKFVKNLIYEDILWSTDETGARVGRPKETEYSDLIDKLTYFCEWDIEEGCEEWQWLTDDNCIFNICTEDTDLDNYTKLMDAGQYKGKRIVEGFIVLQRNKRKTEIEW
jgi:hypothetical protein